MLQNVSLARPICNSACSYQFKWTLAIKTLDEIAIFLIFAQGQNFK